MISSEKILLELWGQAPLSWAIIRVQEVELLRKCIFKRPILEIGCGDGLVSELVFNHKKNAIDVGIDLSNDELRRAAETGLYKKLLCDDITHTSLKKNSYQTIFANGVLEHIPNLQLALKQISMLLKPGGTLITTSPTDSYGKLLFYSQLFRSLGLENIAQLYDQKLNKFFAHHHLYNHSTWQQLLLNAGLKLKRYQYYDSPKIVAVHDIALPFAVGSTWCKSITDKLALFPNIRKLLIRPLIPPLLKLVHAQSYTSGGSILLVASK